MPQGFDKIIHLLKSYVNLLHACFGATCPLSISNRETISTLEGYLEGAQDSMTERTMAAILWKIFKQTKWFALGNMTGSNPLLPEYRVMQDNLMARQAIMHCELPEKFLAPKKNKTIERYRY